MTDKERYYFYGHLFGLCNGEQILRIGEAQLKVYKRLSKEERLEIMAAEDVSAIFAPVYVSTQYRLALPA